MMCLITRFQQKKFIASSIMNHQMISLKGLAFIFRKKNRHSTQQQQQKTSTWHQVTQVT